MRTAGKWHASEKQTQTKKKKKKNIEEERFGVFALLRVWQDQSVYTMLKECAMGSFHALVC